MKKTKRIVTTALAAMLAATSVSAMIGCGKKIANDEMTLEIYVANFGYGYDWVDEAIKLFKEQDWVKTKYPNLKIPTPSHNSERTYTADRITSGPTANTVDLFFSCADSAASYFVSDSKGNSYYEDLTDLYEMKVPGEGDVTYAQKMIDSYYEEAKVETLDGKTAIYSVPWVDGHFGILYNKDLLEASLGADYKMPNTTNELSQMTTDIKNSTAAGAKTKIPFISASNVNYWFDLFLVWWGQYEGFDAIDRYWNGVDVMENRTWENAKQTGRLRSLEALESLIGVAAGNNHSLVNTMEFTNAQTKFLLGEAMMMPNGDWFENEMRATQEENPYNYDIRFMKTPVISSIVEKCTTVKTDAALSFVVDCVDAGKDYATAKADYAAASYGELSETDYNKIKEARSVLRNVIGHEANIPSYATAKAAAKDFLLFLATDIACESFSKTTGGVSAPFEYDLEKDNPTFYATVSNLHKSRLENVKGGRNLRANMTYRLAYLGGLSVFHDVSAGGVESAFTAQNAKDRMTAQEIYDSDIAYFQKENGANWRSILVKAGYGG